MVCEAMKNEVRRALTDIEREETIVVLFAAESGSRAWGFESANSDYDVRFVYLRPIEWYLDISVEHKRDVIERPITDDLDLVGWDLRKALKLLAKSNPSILEWVSSPLVYQQKDDFSVAIKTLATSYFSVVSSFYHYFSMAKKNYRGYLQGDVVRTKKYFYVLRPLLCVRWIVKYGSQPPMLFDTLLNDLLPDGEVREAIDDLLRLKRSGQELDQINKIRVLNDYIELELQQLSEGEDLQSHPASSDTALNALFLQQLQEYGGFKHAGSNAA